MVALHETSGDVSRQAFLLTKAWGPITLYTVQVAAALVLLRDGIGHTLHE